jgi:hypothetical protein
MSSSNKKVTTIVTSRGKGSNKSAISNTVVKYTPKSKNNNGPNGLSRDVLLSAPTSVGRALRMSDPVMSGSPYSGDGRVRIKHREYITDLSGFASFTGRSISINPGFATMFPWLSTIAKNFVSYRFNNLGFEYETQVSSATSGSVMMAVDFDAANAAPSSKQQLMTLHNAVRSPAWTEACYRADKQDLVKMAKQRYVRPGTLASNLDIKTYDVGLFNIYTQGFASTIDTGEIYVTYDIELETPTTIPSS